MSLLDFCVLCILFVALVEIRFLRWQSNFYQTLARFYLKRDFDGADKFLENPPKWWKP